jgi:hypothetical protein
MAVPPIEHQHLPTHRRHRSRPQEAAAHHDAFHKMFLNPIGWRCNNDRSSVGSYRLSPRP